MDNALNPPLYLIRILKSFDFHEYCVVVSSNCTGQWMYYTLLEFWNFVTAAVPKNMSTALQVAHNVDHSRLSFRRLFCAEQSYIYKPTEAIELLIFFGMVLVLLNRLLSTTSSTWFENWLPTHFCKFNLHSSNITFCCDTISLIHILLSNILIIRFLLCKF